MTTAHKELLQDLTGYPNKLNPMQKGIISALKRTIMDSSNLPMNEIISRLEDQFAFLEDFHGVKVYKFNQNDLELLKRVSGFPSKLSIAQKDVIQNMKNYCRYCDNVGSTGETREEFLIKMLNMKLVQYNAQVNKVNNPFEYQRESAIPRLR